MLELDGSDGGGQLLRTALSLSALSGRPFRMEGIRGDRPNPGLAAAHLATVEAIAAIADADVADGDGDEPAVGTDELTFEPGAVEGGEYAVDVGTAGSVTLLFDAVLPVATALDGPLRLTVRGGTDVKWSTPLDYLRYVKLPAVRTLGVAAALEADRRGFYPEGGGAVTLHLAPSELAPPDWTAAADRETARVYSVASDDLADAGVADRQAAAAAGRLEEAGVEPVERASTYAATRSTGSAVMVRLDGAGPGDPPAGFDALGEPGKPAEDVAEEAVEAALAFREGPGAVDGHMADQLVPYLALSGGEVRIPAVTDHVATCVDLVGEFGFEVGIEERAEGAVLVGGEAVG